VDGFHRPLRFRGGKETLDLRKVFLAGSGSGRDIFLKI
jgi:hypothetical protein